MHWINKILSFGAVRLSKVSRNPATPEFLRTYNVNYRKCKDASRDFVVFKEFYYEAGEHPASFVDYECSFAARHLYARKPKTILDIGSYRVFILGLLGHYKVTTIDVRERECVTENEIVLASDAKHIPLPDKSFDAIVSLCALEHFGLGRYGDEFDLNADASAMNEFQRLLKPGGTLIFSTSLTRAHPSIAFNGHRIYSLEMIHKFCSGLKRIEEKYFSHTRGDYCALEQITTRPKKWDVYMGAWEKGK